MESLIHGRVLIVDSDEFIRSQYRAALQSDLCDVVEAGDGRDAMAKAFVRRPSAVITEIRLPILDGLALCEILRRDPSTNDVPLLVVTEEHKAATLARARAVANAIVLKPAPVGIVLDALRRLTSPSATDSIALMARVDTAIAETRKLVKQHRRFSTTAPPDPPPALECPSCNRPLEFEHSYVGGVNERHQEQWDYYVCRRETVRFQYRHRTRKLRRVADSSGA